MEAQVAEAIEAGRARVQGDSHSSAAWGELGMLFHAHELFREASASYAEASRLDGEAFRWPYLRAQALKEIRDLEAARSALREAIDRRGSGSGGYAPLHVLEGELFELEGNASEAMASYRRALDTDPECAPAAYGIGRLSLANGDTEAAREYVERAAELAPHSGAVHATLARLYRRLGSRERALEAAARARALHPEVPLDDPVMAAVAERAVSIVGIQNRAVEAEARGEPRRAEALIRRMLELRPEEADLHYNLGNNLSRQGRFAEAEAAYEDALSLQPDHVAALINLANAVAQRGDLDQGEHLFERALETSPARAGALSGLGFIAARRGEVPTAIRYLERAVEADPLNAEAHYVLGQLYRRASRLPEAIRALARALELDPDRGDVHVELAVSLAQNGDFLEAWRHVRAAEELGASLPDGFKEALSSQVPEPVHEPGSAPSSG